MQLTFSVPDLACGACLERIIQAIHSIDPHAVISADLQTKLVQIKSESAAITLQATITDAGYTPSLK